MAEVFEHRAKLLARGNSVNASEEPIGYYGITIGAGGAAIAAIRVVRLLHRSTVPAAIPDSRVRGRISATADTAAAPG